MRHVARFAIVLLALTVALPALGDDQQKARKELNKVTAMASDPTGRRMVNLSLSEMLSVKRPELVYERRDMNLNYGSLFVAHKLTAGGAKMSDIAAQLKAGKNIFQVANDLHADWKQMAEEAKKLNARIDDNLYKHFLDFKAGTDRDQADSYELALDGVMADKDVSEEEINQAGDRYVLWRDRASTHRDKKLDTSTEQAARHGHDSIRNGGPQTDQVGNTMPPK